MRPTLTPIGSAAPDPEVVDVLTRLLEEAKAGRLRSIVYAGDLAGGDYMSGMVVGDAVRGMGLMYLALHHLGENRMRASTPR